ncbi:helix-turn-helix domain-containing protein [Paenibacillus hexagrammi]|uniref:Helix-turn-helix domain-containing protein n=1 Tax=Paenibacillus hexagrammi TaxID=2908839 RepID=A0ABY3SH16_9BACL|nr:helix-turn-helix domain-containing protein [Paenibacillus sp. YPD9-1]UJF32380.1 helix-turn-helix domain-containing protein [Paenibacillus sp. YPD9-1]
MYTLILVDDEDEVREGIISRTNWAACGFQLVGAFENGRDAAEALESLRPDVIITDISMPFMNGLELTRIAMETCKDTKIVIITGYEEFEYAKQAISLKVSEYLMKPINLQEFTAFLEKLKLELDDEHMSRENLSTIRQQLNQSLPLLKERFLERMVSSIMKKDEIDRRFKYFDLSLAGSYFIALVAGIDDLHTKEASRIAIDANTDIELLQFAVYNIFQEIFEKEHAGIVFRNRDDNIVILLSGDGEEVGTLAQTLASQTAYSVEKFLRLSLTIGVGRTYTSLPHLSKSYQEACSALDYRLLLGSNRLICITDLERGIRSDTVEYLEWEKRLLSALKMGKGNQVSKVLTSWLEEWRSTGLSVERCFGMLHKLLAALMNWVTETGCDEVEVFGRDPFGEMKSYHTLDHIKQWLEELCHRIVCHVGEKRNVDTQNHMQLAVAYIHEHYGNETLSLQQVCAYIFMSSSYFSALFKQHTGLTFVEYLTKHRMEKAKELLLATALKTYEIAARVGYSDPQYFSVIFKRQTGMTPKEFRNRIQAGEAL